MATARAVPAALAPLPQPRGHRPLGMALTPLPAAIPEPTALRSLCAIPGGFGAAGGWIHGTQESWHPAGCTGVTPGPPAVTVAKAAWGAQGTPARLLEMGRAPPAPGLHPSRPQPECEAPGLV